jgi:hypothetical protein
MVSDTKRLIEEEKGERTIAEASFYWDGLFCSVDLLRVHGEECSIVEVKSSTEVKDIYVDDLAFQYYVLSKCGMKIKSASLMHIDSSYERHGELELDKLFVVKDYTDVVKDKLQEVEDNVRQIRLFQENTEEPEKDIALCCEVPYECAYYDYCRRHIPERSVFDIKGLFTSKKYEYYHQGIISFEDVIRCNPKLTDKQLQQVETEYFDRIGAVFMKYLVDHRDRKSLINQEWSYAFEVRDHAAEGVSAEAIVGHDGMNFGTAYGICSGKIGKRRKDRLEMLKQEEDDDE